jgi:hypothetical protein
VSEFSQLKPVVFIIIGILMFSFVSAFWNFQLTDKESAFQKLMNDLSEKEYKSFGDEIYVETMDLPPVSEFSHASIPGRMYMVNDNLVVYMGDNVFFKYDLSAAYTYTNDAFVAGTSDEYYVNLLKEYTDEWKNNHHNPLNYAVTEELYQWALSKTGRYDVIGVNGGAGPSSFLVNNVRCSYDFLNNVVNTNNAGKDVFTLTSGSCTAQTIQDAGLFSIKTNENGLSVVKEGYCCDCLIRAGLNYVFAGEYGGCTVNHKFNCFNGLELSWSLASLGFAVDIVGVDESLKGKSTVDDPKWMKNYYYKSFLTSNLDNVWMKNSKEYFKAQGISLDARAFLFSDAKSADDFMAKYTRGSILGEQHGGLGHMGFKADEQKTIEAHIADFTVTLDYDNSPGYNNGIDYTNIIIHPSGERSVLDDIKKKQGGVSSEETISNTFIPVVYDTNSTDAENSTETEEDVVIDPSKFQRR